MTKLDGYDLKLLAELQKDARISQSDLGERVCLSTAAVNRRLKRMADEGVIENYTAIVSPSALGYGVSILVTVEIESEQVDLLDAMKRSFESCPQIQQCYYVAGEWDFVLMLTVRDMAQYNELTRQLFFANNNVKRFKTLVVMDQIKASFDVPVELEA